MFFQKLFLRILQYIQQLIRYLGDRFFLFLSNLYQIFFLFFNKSGLEEVVAKNRMSLNTVDSFIDLETRSTSKDFYGLPLRALKHIDSMYNNYPTYSDLILYLLNSFSSPTKYVEIGVSVLKNLFLISSGKTGLKIFAYDINKINPVLEKYFIFEKSKDNIKEYTHNNNKISYFQGDVFNNEDLQNFKSLINKVDFIYSDAHHSFEGLMSEYDNLIKDILNDEFIIYYDDLSADLLRAFMEISNKISVNYKVQSFTFLINGWVGNHEKMHRNGVITSLNLVDKFKNDGVKLFLFKQY